MNEASPLAACVLLYEAITQQRKSAVELRARLIEIDGKVSLIEKSLDKILSDIQSGTTLLRRVHRRLSEDGDVGRRLSEIDVSLRALQVEPELEEFDDF